MGSEAQRGDNYLAADIVLFLVAVIVGQLVSYRIMMAQQARKWVKACAMAGMVMMAAAFAVFSYAPPRVFLFEDTGAHDYGILEDCGE